MIIAPNLGPTFNFYFTEVLNFSPDVMGQLAFISSAAYLIGILALNTIFKRIKFKSFYLSTSILYAFISSSSLVLLF